MISLRQGVVARLILLAGYGLICIAYYFWTASGELGEFGGDSATYLLIAQFLSPWDNSSSIAEYFAKQSLYPPLYPLFLALVGGAADVFVAHVATTTALLFAFPMLYLWCRELQWPAPRAAATALVFALLPGTYFLALAVWSENLYLAFSLAALWAASRAERHGQERQWVWVAAACVAGAALTRSAGVALIAAFVVYLAVRRPPRAVYQLLLAVVPSALWSAWKSGPGYSAAFLDKVTRISDGGIIKWLGTQFNYLWYGWISNLSTSGAVAPALLVVAALALAGMLLRLYQRRLDGFYAAAYVALIFIWPFPAESQRLMYVIVPVLLVQCMLFVAWGLRVARSHIVDWLVPLPLAVLAVIALPDLVLTVQRFNHELPVELAEHRRSRSWYKPNAIEAMRIVALEERILAVLRELPAHVNEEDCVYGIKPSLIGYYAGRRGVAPPRQDVADAAFYAMLEKQGCRHFVLLPFSSPTYSDPYYPAGRMRDSLIPLPVVGPRDAAAPVAVLARWNGEIPVGVQRGGVQTSP